MSFNAPDPRRRRIKVPVRVVGNTITPADGNPLPALKDNVEVELVFEAGDLKDPGVARELTAENTINVLPAESPVFFGMSPEMMDEFPRNKLIKPEPFSSASPYLLVRGLIREDLQILDRRNKSSTLLGCRCEIPLLQLEAISLNHAFTLISTQVETRRRSHTGNVFDRVFVHDGEYYWPLRNACDEARKRTHKDQKQQ